MNHRNLWAAAFCAIAAIAACRPAVGADFAFAAEAVKQGDLLLEKDDFDGAISAYAAAIRLDPKLAEAYYNRGLAYEKKGEQAKAEGDFAQAKKLGYKTREKKGYPPYPGDYDSLFPNSTQAIRPGAKCLRGHYDRGGASLRKGDLDKALADFAEAFRLNPKRAEACYGRGANEEEFAAPLKMQPIPPQIIAAGSALAVAASVEEAQRWKGNLRYSLAPGAPRGARIDPQSGEFSWTPPPDHAAATENVSVSAAGVDGQKDATSFRITVAPKELAVDLGKGVKLELVLIPAGEFLMGSPDADDDAALAEQPQHRVRIIRPFYLGKHLVTQEQWKAVTGGNPSRFQGPKNPVEQVSWDDCQAFLRKLNRKTGGQWGRFALPSEAQWEYACRAGSTTRYNFKDDEWWLGKYAWFDENADKTTHPVGGKQPNAWGLYDTYGNVWQWCADWYAGRGYYADSPADDPTGPARGLFRVSRGGSWSSPAKRCRSADRFNNLPTSRSDILGFRVSLVLGEAVAQTRLPESAAPPSGRTPLSGRMSPDDIENIERGMLMDERQSEARKQREQMDQFERLEFIRPEKWEWAPPRR